MRVLELFFNNPPKIDNYKLRKIELPNSSFNLYGARGVGKSALVINYLNSLKRDSYLYIDCQDPIFIMHDIDSNSLSDFINEESIDTLVLDHYFEGFLDYIPTVNRVIIVSAELVDINSIDSIKLFPLDFEEFYSFQRASTPEHNFSLYTKYGSLPKIAISGSSFSYKELFFEKFTTQEGKVLLILALFNAKMTSKHQIYQKSKEFFKISKDWLYKVIKRFEDESVVYWIDSVDKSLGKKLLIYDFAFAKYLNRLLDFNSRFDSIVALALIKQNIEFKAYENRPYYLTNKGELIIVSALENEESFWRRVQSNFSIFSNLKLKSVTIVTNSIGYSFEIKGITFNAMPFYEWVTGLK